MIFFSNTGPLDSLEASVDTTTTTAVVEWGKSEDDDLYTVVLRCPPPPEEIIYDSNQNIQNIFDVFRHEFTDLTPGIECELTITANPSSAEESCIIVIGEFCTDINKVQ